MANGTLEILLVEAQGLKDRDKCILGCLNVVNPWKSAAKPYAHIVYGNQEHTSDVGEGRKRCAWNQKFIFDAKYPADGEEDKAYKLVIRLMDKHKFSDDDFLGETTVYVKDILSLGMEKGKLEVEPRKYRVVQSDKTYSGEISIVIAFIKGKEGIEEEPEDLQEMASLSEKCSTTKLFT